jgi:hypothetical protein
MFYNLSAEGDVEYDLRRFNNDEDARDALVQERAILDGEDKSFDDMFGTNRHPTDDDSEVETAI